MKLGLCHKWVLLLLCACAAITESQATPGRTEHQADYEPHLHINCVPSSHIPHLPRECERSSFLENMGGPRRPDCVEPHRPELKVKNNKALKSLKGVYFGQMMFSKCNPKLLIADTQSLARLRSALNGQRRINALTWAAVVITASSLTGCLSAATTCPPNCTIAGPSRLEVNLGPLPFDGYLSGGVNPYMPANPQTNPPTYGLACPTGVTTVRGCYQAILNDFARQGVSGVRVMFGICGGGYSTPLQNCGQVWTRVSGPVLGTGGLSNICNGTGGTWIQGTCAFFADMRTAGIYNVTLTPALGDFGWNEVVGCPSGCTTTIGPSPGPSPACNPVNTGPALMYAATLPYGLATCSNTPPYTQPSSCNGQGTCQCNAGYPANGSDNWAYNCSASNPVFAGWQNIYNAINAVLAAAKQNSLTVSELDAMNEINTVAFAVQARHVVDNAHTQTGNPNVVDSLHYYLSYWGFDPGRLNWDSPWSRSTQAGFNCLDVYTDYARAIEMDSIASAVGGGYIGVPLNASAQDGLYCGGSVGPQPGQGGYNAHTSMFQFPVGHAQPDIVDVHDYPCVAPSGCASTDSAAQVSGEAAIDFTDIVHFMALVNNSSALFVVGETHSNTNNTGTYGNPSGLECGVNAPLDSAYQTVTGYNSSSMAGHNVVFRPWSYTPEATAKCYNWNPTYNGYPANQQINVSANNGPYVPTQP